MEKKSDYNSKNTDHAFVAGFFPSILVKNPYIISKDPFMLKKSTKYHAFRAAVPCENSSKFVLLWLQETHSISAWVLLKPRY